MLLDLIKQIFSPGSMTRIQEPDLLINHDSGRGGCKRFLGGPVVEPFAFSSVAHMANDGSPNKIKSGGLSGKWFPFSSKLATKKLRMPNETDDADAVSFSSSSSTSTSPAEEKPIIIVHNNNNNNNNVIVDMLGENTRWSPPTTHPSDKQASPPVILPPPAVVPSSNLSGLMSSTTKPSRNSSSSSSNNIHNKLTIHSKNNNSNNHVSKDNKKIKCKPSISSDSCSNNSIIKIPKASRISCGPTSVTAGSHISSSGTHYHGNGISNNDDSWRSYLRFRCFNCDERNKKQLGTFALVFAIFLLVVVILLMFFVPTSTRTSVNNSSDNSRQVSDSLVSSDITNSLNELNDDDVELDDSDSYDDTDMSYYSSTTSTAVHDKKSVSRISWDMLNSNQDASSRASKSSNSGRGGSFSPLDSLSSSDDEIVLPSKMVFTDLGGKGGSGLASQNKSKRSCCRTQKYTQVIKRDGCKPITIVNKMCFGQCVSVWVPGLFASFPVCRPSKSTFKTFTLTCGKNNERTRRVRVEKVRRCSCMEIEPTAASL